MRILGPAMLWIRIKLPTNRPHPALGKFTKLWQGSWRLNKAQPMLQTHDTGRGGRMVAVLEDPCCRGFDIGRPPWARVARMPSSEINSGAAARTRIYRTGRLIA